MCLLVAPFKHLLIVDHKKPCFIFFHQLIFFSLILALCAHKKNSAIHRNEDEKDKQLFDHDQLIDRNAENYEGETLNKNKNMIYQGMDVNQQKHLVNLIENTVEL